MTIDLTKAAAYSDKTPYELWQEQEGIPIYRGLGIDDLDTWSSGRGSAKPPPAHSSTCSAPAEVVMLMSARSLPRGRQLPSVISLKS